MKKLLLAGVAAAAFCGAHAIAADLPTKGPVYRADPLFNWTGFYVGGNLGYGWGNSDFRNVTDLDVAFFPTGSGGSLNLKGWVGGGQLGYNWQSGQWVAGLEASYSASGMKDDVSSPSYLDPAATVTVSSKFRNIVSGTVKIGIANNRWLTYVDAGYAGADVVLDLSRSASAGLPVFGSADFSRWHNGWTAGFGVDYAFAPNASLGISYNYYDFGSLVQLGRRIFPLAPVATGDPAANRVSATASIVLVKLNYLFGAR